MHFEGQTLEYMKKCFSNRWGIAQLQKAIPELEHDERFQSRMREFKAVRKLNGDQWLKKFNIDLVGETVIARRAFRI